MAGDVLAISEKEDDAGHSGVGDMKKRVTLKEVAQAVGVHFSTASRALDPKTRQMLNPKLVEEILKVSRELGYRQNAAAYSLKTNRTRTIGVVVPDITNPIFPPMIRGIEDALGEQGYLAILGNTDSNSERERELLRYFVVNPGRAISRDEILSRVWRIDPKGISTRTIDMHAKPVRLGQFTDGGKFIGPIAAPVLARLGDRDGMRLDLVDIIANRIDHRANRFGGQLCTLALGQH